MRAAAAWAGLAALLVGGPAFAGERDIGAACWTPAQLSARAGESRIERDTRRALLDPPTGAIAGVAAQPRRGVVRRVKLPPGQKFIALTFDLCEQPFEIAGYQGEIVDILRKYDVKATFFVGGKWMLTHVDRAQQLMSDPLFEVGNHTWEHRNLRILAGAALKDEIERTELAYQQVRMGLAERQCIARASVDFAHQRAPQQLSLFRFPFGSCSPRSLDEVARQGLVPIQWDVSSGDPWIGQQSATMTRNVVSLVRPGSIVLFHANGRGWKTAEALPSLILELRDRGFEFVTVSELMARGEPEFADTCFDSKPGDADKYDNYARRTEEHYQRVKAALLRAPRPAPAASQVPPARAEPVAPAVPASPTGPAAPEAAPAQSTAIAPSEAAASSPPESAAAAPEMASANAVNDPVPLPRARPRRIAPAPKPLSKPLPLVLPGNDVVH